MNRIRAYWLELLLLFLIPLSYCIFYLSEGNSGVNCGIDSIEILSSYNLPVYCRALTGFNGRDLAVAVRTSNFPPLYSLGGACAYLAAGRDWAAAVALHNTFYLILLLAGMYLLGVRTGDRTVGLIAAVLLAAHPFILGSFQKFSLDLAMTAAVVVSVYLLLKSDSFKEPAWSIAFAASFGVGMMIKDAYAVFLAGPALYAAVTAARDPETGPGLRRRLTLLTAVALVIAAPYYFNVDKLALLVNRPFSESGWNAAASDAQMLTTSLFTGLPGVQYLPLLALGAFFFFKGRGRGVRPVVLLWAVVPVAVLLCLPHWKSQRYLLPVLPALILVCAAGIRPLIGRWYGKALLAAVVALSTASGVEVLSGKTFGRVTAFLARNYTSHKTSVELIVPAATEKRNAAILKGIVDGVRGFADRNGLRSLSVLAPYSNESFGPEVYAASLLWLNGVNALEFSVPVSGADALSQAYLKRDVLDLILCSDRDGGTGGAIPFREVADSWKRWHMPAAADEKECEEMWNELTATFSRRELVYRDGLASFYLCSRQDVPQPDTAPGDEHFHETFIRNNAKHRRPVTEEETERLCSACRGRAPSPEKSGVSLDRPGLRKAFIDALRIGFLLEKRPQYTVSKRETCDHDSFTEMDVVLRDPDIGELPVMLLLPQRAHAKLPAVIALHGHVDKDALPRVEIRDRYLGKELAQAGFIVAIPRFRAMRFDDAEERVSKKLFMNGFSLMGIRVYETLLVEDYLRRSGFADPGRIGIIGHSVGSVTAYFASMISDGIKGAVYDHLDLCEMGKRFHCQTIPALYDVSAMTDKLGRVGIPAIKVPYGFEERAPRKRIVQFFRKTLSNKP